MHPIARDLIQWFGTNRRDLPWRREPRDPYAVWVSEVMLQQTQVATAVPYFERFLARFPTVAALAAAPEAEVLKLWEGLGYYSRARNLHRAAKELVARHGGRVPADAAALADLPGFGPYTVGAVGSLAHGLPLPAVDGNVLRVASRIVALEEDVGSKEGRAAVEALVREWLPPAAPGPFNEGLMELGATVCTPKGPACPVCPLAAHCRARAAGTQERYPRKERKAAPAWEDRVMIVARAGERVLLVRPASGLLAGLWGFPTLPLAEGTRPEAEALRLLREAGAAPLPSSPRRVLSFRKAFTHRRWRVEAVEVLVEKEAWESGDERAWIPIGEAAALALGDPSKRVLAQVRGNPKLS
ncbi:MAG TPA: A/G-specific adenine glycosylase [Candidatus Thermoplasmatota archaeon]|nr:A/G-specific adenine glycosylase [Candidatus Thermoplasmatota archaeon]